MDGSPDCSAVDRRFMAAAIRYAMRHSALTGSNPAVGTLIVKDEGNGPVIVGRGVTALGGRPHAEAQALGEAGERASGATAYVTLEPCAHHGRTPPCAVALSRSGITRLVAATMDPDERVCGRGFEILRQAGIEVATGVCAAQAEEALAGYLTQRTKNRPHVTLKLAVSADGKIGRKGAGQVAISGSVSRDQMHVMRAQSDAILVGIGTAVEDDPELTVRLEGLEDRSPVRIVLDDGPGLPLDGKLMKSATRIPVWLATTAPAESPRLRPYREAGVTVIACARHNGRVALPELLDDLGARGLQTVMVEGGGAVAAAFLRDDLVDRIALLTGPGEIGPDGIDSPVTRHSPPVGFVLKRKSHFGDDIFEEFGRQA